MTADWELIQHGSKRERKNLAHVEWFAFYYRKKTVYQQTSSLERILTSHLRKYTRDCYRWSRQNQVYVCLSSNSLLWCKIGSVLIANYKMSIISKYDRHWIRMMPWCFGYVVHGVMAHVSLSLMGIEACNGWTRIEQKATNARHAKTSQTRPFHATRPAHGVLIRVA